ncbi:hypothetical protein [Neisseria dentiae]|nr:hypothetical protein [Neisseria dentiae]MCQ9325483.1 hypothetical protein [Neisseria dentiae]
MELIEDFANIFAKEHNINVILKGFKPQYDEEGNNYNTHVRVAHRSTI